MSISMHIIIEVHILQGGENMQPRRERDNQSREKRLHRQYSNEYSGFLRHLYFTYLEKKINRSSVFSRIEEWNKIRSDYLSALSEIRMLQHWINRREYPSIADTAYGILNNAMPPLRDGMRITNDLILDTELADELDEYWETILENTEAEDFPPEDLEALRQSGSIDPLDEIRFYLLLLRGHKDFLRQQLRSDDLIGDVTFLQSILSENRPKEVKAQKRWFKSFAGIGSGCLLFITDIANATMQIKASHPVDCEGFIVSISNGLLIALNGYGEFKGE